MRWRTEGIRLEDLVPVPSKQPGRHFSAGYHMLGNLSRSYDVKYALMTYGDHYRKKIEDDIIRERNRLDDIMMSTKQQIAEHRQSMDGSRNAVNKRYNLNELRHHQRRCAALLFGARQQGAHQVPYLVRWAPRRRESYYLMSERVYNDRLLMKLREQEEEEKRKMLESPMNFDFGDKFGTTSHLYDFQNLISKTSKDIKGMSFDTQYKDYDYEFKEGERAEFKEPQGRVMLTPPDEDKSHKSKESKVKFGDVTDLESNGQSMSRLNRERRRAARAARKAQGLNLNDIDIDFSPDALDDLLGEGEGKAELQWGGDGRDLGEGSLGSKSYRGSRSRRTKTTSKSGNSTSQELSDNDLLYSSDWTEDEEDDNHEVGDGITKPGGAHNNKHCKHSPTSSLKKRSEEYYKKLPRLLKTSELRKKVTENGKLGAANVNVGPYVNHDCMLPYKTAYERALALVRSRSLPKDPADLYNRTSRMTFSYIPGMPGSEGLSFNTKSGEKKHVITKTPPRGPQGMKGILGNVDMNHFYREEDELIYYVKTEEINVVVESSDATTVSRTYDDSDDDSDDDSSEAITRSTSEANTLKSKTSLDTDAESVPAVM